MNELNNKPGVHVIGLYAQVHSYDDIDEVITKHKINYPLAMGGFWEAGYQAPSLPRVWVIGTDGKVAFVGAKDYDKAIETELAKVKYPGLGHSDVHKTLEPAAKAFAEGKFAEAYKLAEAVYDDTEDETAETDAEYIMERIDDRIGTLTVRAETAEVIKNYRTAIACWTELLRYKGLDDAEEAPERLKKLNDSETVKKELKASQDLIKLMMDLDVDYQVVDDTDATKVAEFRRKCLTSYREFAKKNEGTGAGDRAKDLIKTFEALLPNEPPQEEK